MNYKSRAANGLTHLGEVCGLDAPTLTAIPHAVDVLFGRWGERTTRTSRTDREAGPPFEYSISASDEQTELRLFFKPLNNVGETSDLDSWSGGWSVLRCLEQAGVASLQRAEKIAKLFTPSQDGFQFGLCLGAAIDSRGIAKVKAYFDGFGDGLAGNLNLVKSFASQLGHETSSRWIDDYLHDLRAPILSLDATSEIEARMKIYTIFAEGSIEALERRCSSLPEYQTGDATRLLQRITSRWDSVLEGPGTRPLLCWSFTRLTPDTPSDLTLYLPFNSYQPNATKAIQSLGAIGAPAALINVCRLAQDQDATDVDVNPFHWLAFKFGSARGSMTLYLSAAELDRVMGSSQRTDL